MMDTKRSHLCYACSVSGKASTFVLKTRKSLIWMMPMCRSFPMKVQRHVPNFQTASILQQNKLLHPWIIEGFYGAFVGAASMQTSSSTNTNVQTCRLDAYCKTTSWELQPSATFKLKPESKLNNDAKQALLEQTPENIERLVGVFFPVYCCLGGLYRESYIMKANANDSQSSIEAEISAQFGVILGGGAKASFGTSTGSRISESKLGVQVQWYCEGGASSHWLQITKDNAKETQAKWVASMIADNMFPVDFKMRPIRELIEPLDEVKAKCVQDYLVNKWSQTEKLFAMGTVYKALFDSVDLKRVAVGQPHGPHRCMINQCAYS